MFDHVPSGGPCTLRCPRDRKGPRNSRARRLRRLETKPDQAIARERTQTVRNSLIDPKRLHVVAAGGHGGQTTVRKPAYNPEASSVVHRLQVFQVERQERASGDRVIEVGEPFPLLFESMTIAEIEMMGPTCSSTRTTQ